MTDKCSEKRGRSLLDCTIGEEPLTQCALEQLGEEKYSVAPANPRAILAGRWRG
jgi:hypothetical protein